MARRIYANRSGSATQDELCVLCKRPVDSLDDFLNLDFVHPDSREWYAWGFSHPTCGGQLQGNAYAIQLERIREKGDPLDPYSRGGDTLVGWETHLREKNWFGGGMLGALVAAHQLAAQLSRRAA